MTKKDKALALWAVATDEDRKFLERRAAAAELLDLQKAMKVSWPKLGLAADARAALEARLGPEPTTTHRLGGLTIETNVEGFRLLRGDELEAAQLEHGVAKEDGFEMSEEELSGQTMRPKPDPEEVGPSELLPDAVTDASTGVTDLMPSQSTERGLISAAVRRLLLDTDLPYSAIVERVRAEHPGARTSARSVASTAADMRRAGRPVRERRAPAAAK